MHHFVALACIRPQVLACVSRVGGLRRHHSCVLACFRPQVVASNLGMHVCVASPMVSRASNLLL